MNRLFGDKPSPSPSPAELEADRLKEKQTAAAGQRNQAMRAQNRRGVRSLFNTGLGISGQTTSPGSPAP